MARIAGVDLPRDKRVVVSLTYIYGIGRPTAEPVSYTHLQRKSNQWNTESF